MSRPKSSEKIDVSVIYHHNFGQTLDEKYIRVADCLLNPSYVLEIGCHTGYFSRMLIDRGHSVVGLESNEQAVTLACAQGVRVISADVEQPHAFSTLGEERFDVVLLMDVLEHLLHPDEVLWRVKGLLTPEGRIVVTGPNIANWGIRKNLLFGRWEYTDTGILDRTHLHFYTASGWRSLVEQAGYAITKFESADGLVPLVHWLGLIPPWRKYLPSLHRRGVKLFPGLFTIDYLIEAAPLATRA